MKKNHLITAALVAAIMIGSVPLQAESIKEKATKRFNASLDRFRRCIQLKCSKREALKTARDVSLAIAAVIAAAYGAGEFLKGVGKYNPPIYRLGKQLQWPVKRLTGQTEPPVEKVTYRGRTWTVIGPPSAEGKVDLVADDNEQLITIAVEKLTQ